MRFRFVDGLRGFAAVWVMVFHLHDIGEVGEVFVAGWPQVARWLAGIGHLGVDIFFVISGFVMAYALRGDEVSGRFMARFVARRSLRLDPPYWAVIGVLLLEGLGWRLWLGEGHGGLPSAGRLLAHLLYLQVVLGYDQMLAVFWTLCREFQFYLVFVLMLWGARSPHLRGGWRLWGFGVATVVALGWAVGVFQENVWQGLFFPQWYMFLLGAWTWWVAAGKAPRWWLGVLWGVLAVEALRGGGVHVALTLATSVALFLAMGKPTRMGGWLGGKGWQYTGKISYSLYLIHPVVGSWLGVLGERVGAQHAAWSAWLWMLGMWGACFGAAHALWWGVERPSIRWAQQVKLRRDASLNHTARGADEAS